MTSSRKQLKQTSVPVNLLRKAIDAEYQREQNQVATGTINDDHRSPTASHSEFLASPDRKKSRNQRRIDKRRAEAEAASQHKKIETLFRAYEARRANGGLPQTPLEAAFETALAQRDAGKAQEPRDPNSPKVA